MLPVTRPVSRGVCPQETTDNPSPQLACARFPDGNRWPSPQSLAGPHSAADNLGWLRETIDRETTFWNLSAPVDNAPVRHGWCVRPITATSPLHFVSTSDVHRATIPLRESDAAPGLHSAVGELGRGRGERPRKPNSGEFGYAPNCALLKTEVFHEFLFQNWDRFAQFVRLRIADRGRGDGVLRR